MEVKTWNAYHGVQSFFLVKWFRFCYYPRLTAHATREVMEKCIDHGMNDFVAKPFDAHDLDQKIKAILIDV